MYGFGGFPVDVFNAMYDPFMPSYYAPGFRFARPRFRKCHKPDSASWIRGIGGILAEKARRSNVEFQLEQLNELFKQLLKEQKQQEAPKDKKDQDEVVDTLMSLIDDILSEYIGEEEEEEECPDKCEPADNGSEEEEETKAPNPRINIMVDFREAKDAGVTSQTSCAFSCDSFEEAQQVLEECQKQYKE